MPEFPTMPRCDLHREILDPDLGCLYCNDDAATVAEHESMLEWRANQDREDGRGRLHHATRIGVSTPIVDVRGYSVTADGDRFATVAAEAREGDPASLREYDVPLRALFALKKVRPMCFEPVPWT